MKVLLKLTYKPKTNDLRNVNSHHNPKTEKKLSPRNAAEAVQAV